MIDIRFLSYEDLDRYDGWSSPNWEDLLDFFCIDMHIKKECISVLKKNEVIIIDGSEYIIEEIMFDVDNHRFYCEVFPNYAFKLSPKK